MPGVAFVLWTFAPKAAFSGYLELSLCMVSPIVLWTFAPMSVHSPLCPVVTCPVDSACVQWFPFLGMLLLTVSV